MAMPTKEVVAILQVMGLKYKIKTTADTTPVVYKGINTESSCVYALSKKN